MDSWIRGRTINRSCSLPSPVLHRRYSPFSFNCFSLCSCGSSVPSSRVNANADSVSSAGSLVIRELLCTHKSTESSRVDTLDSCSFLNSSSSPSWVYWFRSVSIVSPFGEHPLTGVILSHSNQSRSWQEIIRRYHQRPTERPAVASVHLGHPEHVLAHRIPASRFLRHLRSRSSHRSIYHLDSNQDLWKDAERDSGGD